MKSRPSVLLQLTTALSFVVLVTLSCGWFGQHSRLAMTTFNETYGTHDSRLDDCSVCHTTGRSLNRYGQAVMDAIPVNEDPKTDDERARLLREAMAAVENEDSDGDGYSNALEIDDRSFPGDEADVPERVRTSAP